MSSMMRRVIGRVLSVAILGGLFGASVHSGHLRSITGGKADFLAKESIRFEHFSAPSQTLAVLILTYIFVGLLVWMLFEGMAWVFAKALNVPTASR
jgi:branched-subunit amino acid transport protein AzlD